MSTREIVQLDLPIGGYVDLVVEIFNGQLSIRPEREIDEAVLREWLNGKPAPAFSARARRHPG